jgi:hypothetical protein
LETTQLDIFDAIPEDDTVTIDESKDYVAELVGEGKKFKDTSALAKGKYQADMTIEVLKKKLDDLNKELNTRTTLESFLDKMKDGKEPPVVTQVPPDLKPDQLDDEALEARLNAILAQREAKQKQETNADRVKRVLTEQLGDQVQLTLNHRSKELGVSLDELKRIASSSPTAFFKLVGVEETQGTPQYPSQARTSVNSLSTPTNTGVKNKAYYDKMKQTNPKAYFEPKITSEMMRSMVECNARGIPWE